MIPNRSMQSSDSTMANSVIDWPRSLRISILLRLTLISLDRLVLAMGGGGPPRGGPRPGVSVLREERDDGVDRVIDAAAQGGARGDRGAGVDRATAAAAQGEERADGGDRDHAEDDAVLRHRLTLLAPAKRVEP